MGKNLTQPVLCIGSALWDIIANSSQEMSAGDDVAGIIRRRPGGVALNIAVALVEQGLPAALITTIGNDDQGTALIAYLESVGVDCRYVTRDDQPTDSYLAIETLDGKVFGAIADCASLEKAGDSILTPLRDGTLADANNPWTGTAIIDGNLPESVFTSIVQNGDFNHSNLSFVPASPGKAKRLRDVIKQQAGTLFINKGEAEILCDEPFANSGEAAERLNELGAKRAVVTDGPFASAVSEAGTRTSVTPPKVDAKTTTGAGDVFLAAFIAAEIAGNKTHEEILQAAIEAAAQHVTKEDQ